MTYRGDASWGDEAAKKSFRSSSTLFIEWEKYEEKKVLLRGKVVLPVIVNIILWCTFQTRENVLMFRGGCCIEAVLRLGSAKKVS